MLKILFALLFVSALAGCNGSSDAVSALGGAAGGTSASTISPAPSSTPPASKPARTYSTDVLLFNGTGTSDSDAQTLAGIIGSHGASYRMVNSAEISAMAAPDFLQYGTIVWPGGHAATMTQALSLSTRKLIHDVVVKNGVNFLGICAGAWMMVGDGIPTSGALDLGFAFLNGPILNEYFPGGKEPTAAMVDVSFPNGAVRNLVWWGGPYTPTIPHGVVAKYDDGGAAISQAWAGNGFVVLSGPHPEAPQSWRDGEGLVDRDGLDYDIAWQLVNAALKQEPLPAF